jgi:hypothetical protein
VSVIRPAPEFILVTETYSWDLPVETFIISHGVLTLFEEEISKPLKKSFMMSDSLSL